MGLEVYNNWISKLERLKSTEQPALHRAAENAGVMVREGSHVGISSGARIVGTAGNGLAALSNSTVTLAGGPVEIAGSQAQDVFCDPTAVINGGQYITGATKVTCPNLNSGEEYPLPSQ